jgi:hypothetical protein
MPTRNSFRLTSHLLAALIIASSAVYAPAALYNYMATDAPGQGPDATGSDSQPANVWEVVLGSPSTDIAGDFIGNSASNGTGGTSLAGAGTSAWGLYAIDQTFATATASIVTLINSPLTHPTESVSLDFDHGVIDNNGTSGIQIVFLDGANQPQLTFQLKNGDSAYQVFDTDPDSPEQFDSSVTPTFDGFNIKLTLADDAGKYDLSINGTPLFFTPRQLQQGISSIGAIEIATASSAASRPDADVFFNNLSITTVPEAPPVMLISAAVTIIGVYSSIGRRIRRRAA